MSKSFVSNQSLVSVEAERAILGSIMLENKAWDLVANIVLEEDFYQKEHKLIFKTIKNLQDSGKPIDVITVQETLEGNGDLQELLNLGGKKYLAQLAQETISSANIESLAEIVKERSKLRRLIKTVEDISKVAKESDPSASDKMLDEAEERILNLREDLERSTGPKGTRELRKPVFEKLQELSLLEDPLVGISTGFYKLDDITLGFQEQDLIVIAGRPSMGKTSLALNIAENVAREDAKNQKVLIFSLEMSSEQVVRRLISSCAKIDMQRLTKGEIKNDEWQPIEDALTFLAKDNILIDDTAALSPSDVRSISRRVKREHKDLCMIIVDYIGLMHVPGRRDNRVAEISEISRSLKALAKELKLPVIAISQLNRNLESRTNKRPMMQDLRDSGAIEQDADVIAFLYRDEYYNEGKIDSLGEAEVHIAKQRNGPTRTIKLHFRDSLAKFENRAPEYLNPPPYYDEED